MSIPSYNRPVTSPGFDRYEKTNQNFDYYCPGTKYGSLIVSEQDSYIIRNRDVLTYQLAEMFNRNLPEFIHNGEYISKGIININKQQMFEQLKKYDSLFSNILPKDYNRYIGSSLVVDYVVWTYENMLNVTTSGRANILGYRLRYYIPKRVPLCSIKAITYAVYKDLMDRFICYSYWVNPDINNPDALDAVDFIISNSCRRKVRGKRVSTLSNKMNWATKTLNSDIFLAINGINPKTGDSLNLYK